MSTLQGITPASFPWYPYEGYTFCLGLEAGGGGWTSGQTASILDKELNRLTVSGTMTEQARIAYEKVLVTLAAAGIGPGDVTRITENITVAGLEHYEDAVAVRRAMFGDHQPTVRTVIVNRLVRSTAFIEVELHGVKGGGTTLLAASEKRTAAQWTNASVTEGHDGAVYLPTMVPIDENGDVVHPGDFVGQYAYCLEQADGLLRSVGLSLDNAVTTYDYSTPASRDVYRKTHRVRKDLLGNNAGGVYPGAGGILMKRLHHPESLAAIDVTASRHELELVNPGWSRYDTLTYAPGIKAGNTLYMSGFGALDMETQEAMHAGDLAAQAEMTFGAILHLLDYAGLAPEDLLETTEYLVESSIKEYRDVATVRNRMLKAPWPASTGAICEALLRPEFLLEVFPTALYPQTPA